MSKNILVVDDDKNSCMLLSEFLSDEGYEVDSAGTCKAAIEASLKTQFSVAILDLNLPDGSGLDLLKKLRNSNPALKAFILSGENADDLSEMCQESDISISGCITKPFSLIAILALLPDTSGR